MMPPVGKWGFIMKAGKPWSTKPIQLVAVAGGRYQIKRNDGSIVDGTLGIESEAEGFRISTKRGGKSSVVTWQSTRRREAR